MTGSGITLLPDTAVGSKSIDQNKSKVDNILEDHWLGHDSDTLTLISPIIERIKNNPCGLWLVSTMMMMTTSVYHINHGRVQVQVLAVCWCEPNVLYNTNTLDRLLLKR